MTSNRRWNLWVLSLRPWMAGLPISSSGRRRDISTLAPSGPPCTGPSGLSPAFITGLTLTIFISALTPFGENRTTWRGWNSAFACLRRGNGLYPFPSSMPPKSNPFSSSTAGRKAGPKPPGGSPSCLRDPLSSWPSPLPTLKFMPKKRWSFFYRSKKEIWNWNVNRGGDISLASLRTGNFNKETGRFDHPDGSDRMKTINLLFAVHNHQPVGNFEHVFQQAWDKFYNPFLQVLEKHPEFRLSMHYSGSLLEWFEENQPGFLPRLRELVARGQVELLSGGFYEPLRPFSPERDAVGQVNFFNQYLKEKLNVSPQGLWLAERVWNSTLPKTIAPTGLKYTLVDDSHFHYAGLADEDMFGHYVTEQEGFTLSIFPINKRLRYAIPFRAPEETIEALRFWATDSGSLAVTYADDGEKFGLWPGTSRWVFEEGWLEKFVASLEENRDWVHMLTFSEYMGKYPPQGRTYLPPASYDEMMEWALPPLSAIGFEDMVEELKKDGRYEKYKAFLRGGSWENFLVKYTESNHMHKKMLQVSEKVHRILKNQPSPGTEIEPSPPPALRSLWKGQVNCAYWHGLFGGPYLHYLRHGVYQNLIAAERLAEVIEKGGEKYLTWGV